MNFTTIPEATASKLEVTTTTATKKVTAAVESLSGAASVWLFGPLGFSLRHSRHHRSFYPIP